MVHIWIELRLVTGRNYSHFLRDFIIPFQNDEVISPLIDGYHFQSEGGIFLFRIRVKDKSNYSEVEQRIKNQLLELDIKSPDIKLKNSLGNYEGSEYRDGWPIMEQSMEYSSRLTLSMEKYEKEGKEIDREFLNRRIIHCFLNSQGMNLDDQNKVLINAIHATLSIIKHNYPSVNMIELKEKMKGEIDSFNCDFI